MRDPFDGLAFRPADILLPQNCDYTKWSVVACDQYTSQPEYWQEVEELVGSAPSTLRLILPESCLDGPSVETDIMEVNNTMTRYLREERFCTLPASLIYVERRLDNLRLRRGLVGMVDLEQYDYEPGAEAQVRATEGTVMARIPPRVAVRKNAPLELPHVMLLADDLEKTVLEPLSARKDQMEEVYDFDLMERGGHIAGWRLDGESMALVAAALRKLADPAAFRARYGVEDKPVLLFAVGDGNHSLATAKECYERQKKLTPREQWDSLPARYALCELVNLHDASLEFEPIHRVVFGVEPERVVEELLSALPGAYRGEGDGHVLRFSHAGGKGAVTVPRPEAQLEVGTLQPFLDAYVKEHGGSIDYIHGADVARDLAARPGNIAFLLPAMGKEQLFPTVIRDGVLPRKTFSMGLSFFLWAMARFNGRQLGLCGKTITSLRRNLLAELVPYLRRLGFDCWERRSENLLTVRLGGHENRFLLFGGRDESSAALIQGSTLAGVLLDEAALDKILDPYSMTEPGISGKELLEG